MFTAIGGVITTFLYQPFLNVLILFYWILEQLTRGHADMGVAVILLTILIRVLMLPLSLSGHHSEKERREIAAKILEIKEKFTGNPILEKRATKKVLKKNTRILIGEVFALTVQVAIALMLWRMFNTGLPGADSHLIYSFMPKVEQPFNLVFMNSVDLTHTSFRLNFLQSILIFILETFVMFTSIYPVSRDEVVRMQLVLPVVSFMIFMGLPAGKKLFVITTLIFSIILKATLLIQQKYQAYKFKKEEEAEVSDEPVVVKTV